MCDLYGAKAVLLRFFVSFGLFLVGVNHRRCLDTTVQSGSFADTEVLSHFLFLFLFLFDQVFSSLSWNFFLFFSSSRRVRYIYIIRV